MIRTKRLVLRAPKAADFDALHEIFASTEAMQYWDRPPHDPEDTRAFLEGMINNDPLTSHEYVVEMDGRVIGKARCWRLAEVGYIFHPDVWGMGIATEALQAILPNVFENFPDVKQITAEIDTRNIASERVLLRLGFYETDRADRTLEVNGVWTDSTYFALDRPLD